jgi:hypothetical protein
MFPRAVPASRLDDEVVGAFGAVGVLGSHLDDGRSKAGIDRTRDRPQNTPTGRGLPLAALLGRRSR